MVAYTSPDCLPYFECTDSPCLNTGSLCEPSTVFCDQAALIEARLDTFDSIVARTASSTPIAWLQMTTPMVMTVGDDRLVPFDTVRADTDDMANLDVLSSGLTIRTPGLYLVWAWMTGLTNTNMGAGLSMEGLLRLDLSGNGTPYGSATFNGFSSAYETFVNDVIVTANSHMVLPVVVEGVELNSSIFVTGTTNDTITINQVSIGAAWMGGVP